MSCPNTQLVTLYHDGELPVDREAFLRDHVAECDECRMWLSDLRRMSAAFDSSPRVALSAKARTRIEDALLTPMWVRLMLPFARPLAAAAVLLMAIGVPMLIGSASSSTATADTLPAEWETAMLTRDAATTTQAEFATWMVTDLRTTKTKDTAK